MDVKYEYNFIWITAFTAVLWPVYNKHLILCNSCSRSLEVDNPLSFYIEFNNGNFVLTLNSNTQTHRETHTQIQRDTDIDTDTPTHTHTHKHNNTSTERHMHIHIDRCTHIFVHKVLLYINVIYHLTSP